MCKEKAYKKRLQVTNSLSEASKKSMRSFLMEALEVKGKWSKIKSFGSV